MCARERARAGLNEMAKHPTLLAVSGASLTTRENLNGCSGFFFCGRASARAWANQQPNPAVHITASGAQG